MSKGSDIIIEVMKHIDEKLQKIDPKSIDRQRVHTAVLVVLSTEVKRLISLDYVKRKNFVDEIFKTQLNKEIVRKRTRDNA